MDGHDRAALVVLAAEEAQLLPTLEIGLELGDAVHELLKELVVDGVAAHLLAQQLFRGFEVSEPALEHGELLEAALDTAVLGGDLGGGVLVVPVSYTHLRA